MGTKVMPSYKEIEPLKKECQAKYEVEEDGLCAYSKTQDVANKVAVRMLLDPTVQNAVEHLKSISDDGKVSLTLEFKTGMDSSSGHMQNKRHKKVAGQDPLTHCMASVFVPLQLTANVKGKNYIIVTNPYHNSTASCIPLQLWYQKETDGKLQFMFI